MKLKSLWHKHSLLFKATVCSVLFLAICFGLANWDQTQSSKTELQAFGMDVPKSAGDGFSGGPPKPKGPDELDDDNDGLSNADEEKYGTDPKKRDTDDDGLRDDAEIFKHGTDPLNDDTDNDNVPDGLDLKVANPFVPDADYDGLDDWEELGVCDPRLADTDGDSIVDSDEKPMSMCQHPN